MISFLEWFENWYFQIPAQSYWINLNLIYTAPPCLDKATLCVCVCVCVCVCACPLCHCGTRPSFIPLRSDVTDLHRQKSWLQRSLHKNSCNTKTLLLYIVLVIISQFWTTVATMSELCSPIFEFRTPRQLEHSVKAPCVAPSAFYGLGVFYSS